EPANATWTNLTGSQFLGSISDIEFGSSEDELLVTFYNYGVRNVWYTSNANAANPTWVSKEGNLPDLPVLSILANPLNKEEVIIGTELGIWATENFSSNSPVWQQSYNGMSDVKVTDLDLKKGNNVVYAASYGRGMFSGRFKTAVEEAEERGEMVIEDNTITVYPTVSDGTYKIISGETSDGTEVFIYNLQGRLVKVVQLDLQDNIPEEINLFSEASG
ncbi:T9SS type A sorting domain-containing protein, partial [Salinimicrobium oceani]